MTDQNNVLPTVEKWFPFLPVVGTTVAIVYDIGFFWRIDISYYSLFSLSEHIVFATQIIPLALVTAIVLLFLINVRARFRRIPRADGVAQKKRKSGFVILAFLTLLISLLFVYQRKYDLFIAYFSLSLLSIGLYFTPRSQMKLLVPLLMLGFLVGGTFAFSTGVTILRLQSADIEHVAKLKGGDLLEGKILRFGDRIILFFVPASKKVFVLKWEQVDSIENKAPWKP